VVVLTTTMEHCGGWVGAASGRGLGAVIPVMLVMPGRCPG
jgi:hypothetical protein